MTRKFFQHLGGLPLALALVATTLVFVTLGTILEAKTNSHLFAAKFTYQNPFFQLLLALYFLNILFAALSRFPFKQKHIPFLLTHLGLLMILLGVFVKTHFGVQGSLALKEGSGSAHIFLPNTFALLVESPGNQTIIPLKKGSTSSFSPTSSLEITLLEWTPHAEERYEGFFKGSYGHSIGLPPIHVNSSIETPHYLVSFLQDQKSDEVLFPGRSALFFLQDPQNNERMVAFNDHGERFESALTADEYYIYDKGYGGYALFAMLPPSFPQIELIAPLTRTSQKAPLPIKREEQTPRIRLRVKEGDLVDVVTLTYDPYAQKFKWPVLHGKYLMRFQQAIQPIPLHLRLISAEQINFPNSDLPFSYAATIREGNEEKTLSMNHVFEKKGYRFYLANLLQTASGAHQVHFVVNYDPAKYLLTYPGGIVLALGIVLLYLRRRYV